MIIKYIEIHSLLCLTDYRTHLHFPSRVLLLFAADFVHSGIGKIIQHLGIVCMINVQFDTRTVVCLFTILYNCNALNIDRAVPLVNCFNAYTNQCDHHHIVILSLIKSISSYRLVCKTSDSFKRKFSHV